MKKIISILLSLSFLSSVVFADQNCDWTQIKKLPDGGYEYNPTLNICVGQLVQMNKIQAQQIQDLTKAISLKDLAIKDDDSRVQLWETTADSEQNRLSIMESDQKHSEWLYFGLGILTTFVAGYAIARGVR